MKSRGLSAAMCVLLAATGLARGQAPETSAKVETVPLTLTPPDRYQIPSVLEPIRRVAVMATADGVMRTLDIPVGSAVRSGQEIAGLDRSEAAARLKIAQASVKEMQAALDAVKPNGVSPVNKPALAQAEARLEAAKARADLGQLELDACTLRAPFAGRLLAVPVSPGQYLAKGSTVADLADVSSLRVLVPVDRATVTVGDALNLSIEGQVAAGKVQALLPLPENFAPLRELATPLRAAWVVLPNPNGAFEPGQRALSPSIPTAPLATIPTPTLHQSEDEGATPTIQVIRNEYVTTIPVQVLGSPGPERTQITGPMRPTDALIVSSTVPLVAGTLIRFRPNAQEGIEATSPDPDESGRVAGITPPRVSPRTAPMGAPGSALPKSKSGGRPAPRPRPGPRTSASPVPF